MFNKLVLIQVTSHLPTNFTYFNNRLASLLLPTKQIIIDHFVSLVLLLLSKLDLRLDRSIAFELNFD
jgi:hypothetical protein